jgi:hypothetical protein
VGPAGRDYVKEGHEERKRRKNDGLNREVIADDMKKEPSSRRTPVEVRRKPAVQLSLDDSDFSDEEDRARRRKSRFFGFKWHISLFGPRLISRN